MKIFLPDSEGLKTAYQLSGNSAPQGVLPANPARIVYSAAHVTADPFSASLPSGRAAIDWETTLAFRRYLDGLGLGIAEAMDTAQRGMGLDWPNALELIKRTKEDLPHARVVNGCGTDHLDLADASTLDDVIDAYLEQVEAIQSVGARIILMASRALVRVAKSPDDYKKVYAKVLSACDEPVVLHWLGSAFDPALRGYWGAADFETALEVALEVIEQNQSKVDGIKISLLDKEKEILMRRRLPAGVKMYTGDDFNYPELIAGDEQGYSHALLGIFDPIAPLAASAVNRLGEGDKAGFHALLDPTVPLARLMFQAPTQYYKTGVVFLAWLNGFQKHFILLNGAQSMRALPYFTGIFRHADACGLLRDPERAVERMRSLLVLYGAD
ncbi:dihydrodipicolinate synthase family protein [Acetobacter indonesiensis]|uniref:dihydrodipicolinate synthase family protein n=1 Tax=Acetobacter indonesiensis TaxID=104101 RepID=UPI0039E80EB6